MKASPLKEGGKERVKHTYPNLASRSDRSNVRISQNEASEAIRTKADGRGGAGRDLIRIRAIVVRGGVFYLASCPV